MTPRERFQKTFRHEEPDRIPIFEFGVEQRVAARILGKNETDKARVLRKLTQNPGEWESRFEERVLGAVRGQIRLYSRLGYDMLVVRSNMPRKVSAQRHEPSSSVALHRFYLPVEVAENVWREEDEFGFWAVTKYEPIPDVMFPADHSIRRDGIDGLARYVESLETEPATQVDQSQFMALDYAVKSAGELVIGAYADVTCPFLTAWVPIWFEAMVVAPDLAKRYMDVTMQGMMVNLRHQLRLGVEFVMGGNDWYGKNGCHFSAAHFREFVKPYLKMIVDECHEHGVPFIKHLDGNTRRDWQELWVELGIDGYHAIEPTAGMDIGELKGLYGDRLVLLGNLDCGQVLTFGTKEEITDACREIIRKAAPGGGFVFSSSNGIHGGVPTENVWTMIEAAKRYGTYPIHC